MQLYVVAGIWFDSYLLWVGILVTLFTLLSILFFPALFWAFVFLSGATLFSSGIYIRSY